MNVKLSEIEIIKIGQRFSSSQIDTAEDKATFTMRKRICSIPFFVYEPCLI